MNIDDIWAKRAIAVNVSHYDPTRYTADKFVAHSLVVFLPTKAFDSASSVDQTKYRKIEQGSRFMNYSKYLTAKERKEMEKEFAHFFGPKWATGVLKGISSSGKEAELAKDYNPLRFVFADFTILTKVSEVLFALEPVMGSYIEFMAPMSAKKYSSNLGPDEMFGLERIYLATDDTFSPIKEQELLIRPLDEFIFLEFPSNRKKRGATAVSPIVIDVRDYASFFTDHLKVLNDTGDTVTLTNVWEFHLKWFLPLIPEEALSEIFSDGHLMNSYIFEQRPIKSSSATEEKRKKVFAPLGKNGKRESSGETFEKYTNERTAYRMFRKIIINFSILDDLHGKDIYSGTEIDIELFFRRFHTDGESIPVVVYLDENSDDLIVKTHVDFRNHFSPTKVKDLTTDLRKNELVFLPMAKIGKGKFASIAIKLDKFGEIKISADTLALFENISDSNMFIPVIGKILEQLNSAKDVVFTRYVEDFSMKGINLTHHIEAFLFDVVFNVQIPAGRLMNRVMKYCDFTSSLFPELFAIEKTIASAKLLPIGKELRNASITIKPTKSFAMSVKNLANLEIFEIMAFILLRCAELMFSEGKAINRKEDVKISHRVKMLKLHDPKRFDYNFPGIGDYSTIAQKNRQPVLITEDKIKELGLRPNQYVKLGNMSREGGGALDVYAAINPEFPFIGFLEDLFQEKKMCVPSTFRQDQSKKRRTARIYEACTNSSPDDINGKRDVVQSDTYVLNYKTVFPVGRLIYLPTIIMNILGEKFGKTKFIKTDTDLHLIEGAGDNRLTEILPPINGKSFVETAISYLKKHPELFERVKFRSGNKFVVLQNLLDFLSDPQLRHKHGYLTDIIEELYPAYIFLFLIKESKTGGDESHDRFFVDRIGQGVSGELNPAKTYIIIHKYDMNYSPIIRVKGRNINKKGDGELVKQRGFTSEDTLVKFIISAEKQVMRGQIELSFSEKREKTRKNALQSLLGILSNDDDTALTRDEDGWYRCRYTRKKGGGRRQEIFFSISPRFDVKRAKPLKDIVAFVNDFLSEKLHGKGERGKGGGFTNLRIKFGNKSKGGKWLIFLNIPMAFPVKPFSLTKGLGKSLGIKMFEHEPTDLIGAPPIYDTLLIDRLYSDFAINFGLFKLRDYFISRRDKEKRKKVWGIIAKKTEQRIEDLDFLSSVSEILMLKSLKSLRRKEMQRARRIFDKTRFEFDSTKLRRKLEDNGADFLPIMNKWFRAPVKNEMAGGKLKNKIKVDILERADLVTREGIPLKLPLDTKDADNVKQYFKLFLINDRLGLRSLPAVHYPDFVGKEKKRYSAAASDEMITRL